MFTYVLLIFSVDFLADAAVLLQLCGNGIFAHVSRVDIIAYFLFDLREDGHHLYLSFFDVIKNKLGLLFILDDNGFKLFEIFKDTVVFLSVLLVGFDQVTVFCDLVVTLL